MELRWRVVTHGVGSPIAITYKPPVSMLAQLPGYIPWIICGWALSSRLLLAANIKSLLVTVLHSFIHSGHFYSASSSPLLLSQRRSRLCSIDTVSKLTRRGAIQASVSEGLAQGPYVAAGVRFDPETLRTEGTELTRATTPHASCRVCMDAPSEPRVF